ncbi:MAG: glutaredoxin domain-containing protein [Pseudomonadota bacterium]
MTHKITQGPVPIMMFTKPDCSYCARAKATLRQAGLSWDEIDVTSQEGGADASVFWSGLTTVPQIFIGTYHVRGAEDLEQIARTGRLQDLVAMSHAQSIDLTTITQADLKTGAEDQPFRTVIPKSGGARDTDPEAWPIIRFYKDFFGFWPNTFAYLHHWPEAYKLFMYGHNFAAIRAGRKVLSEPLMLAVAYGTSEAQGCNYCQAHSAAFAGDASNKIVATLKSSNAEADSGPIGDYERALVRLASRASHNTVSDSLRRAIEAKADQASGGPRDAQADISATALVVSAFGFLNVFNGLVGMQIEGDWAKSVERVGVEAGRHGAEASNPDNLDYEMPDGGPTLEDMLATTQSVVDDMDAYAVREFGFTPAWMTAFPEDLRKGHAAFYGELMGPRPHSELSSELKHLLARVAAISKGHDHLAAAEGAMAHHVATDKSQAVQRIKDCYAAATDRVETGSLFTDAERAALRIAWLSAQVPLTTPRRFVAPAVEAFGTKGLIEIFTVCGIASLVQRYVAILPQQIEPEVNAFLRAHGLETDTLTLRYPLPTVSEAA